MDFKGIKGEIILCSSAQPVKGNFKRVYFFSELRDFQLAGGFAIVLHFLQIFLLAHEGTAHHLFPLP